MLLLVRFVLFRECSYARSDLDCLAGDYATTLTYTQNGVATATDESLDLILPVLAQPIVQKIVDASAIGYVSHSLVR